MGKITAALIVLLLSCTSASADTAYYVGNSLTWDAGLFTRVTPLAGELGHDITTGHHICCNATLDYIWSNPTDVCVASPEPYGMHGNALPNYAFDFVTLQPFNDVLAGESGAISRINDFRAATQGTPQFYVYQAWPNGASSPSFDYSAKWDRPASVGGTFTRDWFAQLMPAVAPDGVLIIPAGEVLYTIDQRAKAGLIPGINSAKDLYRDDTHMTTTGGYVAALAVVSTVYATSPIGLSHPDTISAEQALALQTAVWDVVSTHPFTGVPEPIATLPVMLALLALRRGRRMRA